MQRDQRFFRRRNNTAAIATIIKIPRVIMQVPNLLSEPATWMIGPFKWLD
jgi:hypothetical protein